MILATQPVEFETLSNTLNTSKQLSTANKFKVSLFSIPLDAFLSSNWQKDEIIVI